MNTIDPHSRPDALSAKGSQRPDISDSVRDGGKVPSLRNGLRKALIAGAGIAAAAGAANMADCTLGRSGTCPDGEICNNTVGTGGGAGSGTGGSAGSAGKGGNGGFGGHGGFGGFETGGHGGFGGTGGVNVGGGGQGGIYTGGAGGVNTGGAGGSGPLCSTTGTVIFNSAMPCYEFGDYRGGAFLPFPDSSPNTATCQTGPCGNMPVPGDFEVLWVQETINQGIFDSTIAPSGITARCTVYTKAAPPTMNQLKSEMLQAGGWFAPSVSSVGTSNTLTAPTCAGSSVLYAWHY